MWKVCSCGSIVSNRNLNEGSILSFGDHDLRGGSIKKPNLSLITPLLPLNTTIDIPIIISHVHDRTSTFEIWTVWVVTSNLQTSIRLDLSKRLLIFPCNRWIWDHISWTDLGETWAWEVRGYHALHLAFHRQFQVAEDCNEVWQRHARVLQVHKWCRRIK